MDGGATVLDRAEAASTEREREGLIGVVLGWSGFCWACAGLCWAGLGMKW